MKAADKAKLARLKRLEKVRAAAKQAAAAEAAEAEGALMQLRALAGRTRDMAGEYSGSAPVSDGDGLRQLGRFVGGLIAIARTTEDDAIRAKAIADAKLAHLAECERRRDAVEKRALRHGRIAGKPAQPTALTARRGARSGLGTGLE